MSQSATRRHNDHTIRQSVAPPAENRDRLDPELTKSDIRQIKPRSTYRPPTPVPGKRPSLVPRAAAPLRSVPKRASTRASSPPPAALPKARVPLRSVPPPAPRAEGRVSTPPPIPARARTSAPPPPPRPAADATQEIQPTDLLAVVPPPPALPREMVSSPPPVAAAHATPVRQPTPQVAAAWPEPSVDDPYLKQLRRGTGVIPPGVTRVMNDLRWAVSPTGRNAARRELRSMGTTGLRAFVTVLRVFADGVEERL